MKHHPCPETPGGDSNPLNLSEFLEASSKPRSVLSQYVPEICIMVALAGAPAATKYINKKLNTSYSIKPIRDIITAVARGDINLTNLEIIAAADKHPRTAALLNSRFPDIRARAGEQFTGLTVHRLNPRSRTKKAA